MPEKDNNQVVVRAANYASNFLSKLTYKNILQLTKFVIVGASNAVVLFVVYNILLKLGLNYQVSYAIGFTLSVLNAYFWNNRFVFKESSSTFFRKLLKVYASYIFTYVLSAVLLYIWIDYLHIMKEIAPIINIIITTPINFLLNKKWAFKKK